MPSNVCPINGGGIVQWTVNGKLVASQNHPVSYMASPDATISAVLLIWADPLNSPQDIIAQKMSIADGSFLWGNEGILVCGRTDAQSEPALIHNGGSGAIISWTDGRNSSQDIYANRVLANGTIPLILVKFEAQLINQDVLLKWSTSSEQNNSYFDVERSADGNNFSSIGKVNATGNSSSTINYSLPDNDPAAGNNFYRLKMVDVDGKFTFCKIITVNIVEGKSLRIYPNPARNTLFLHSSGIDANALFQILDLSGKKVKEQKLVLTGTTFVDISDLPKSVYKIIIKTKTNTEQLTFVKK
ncbi:MAG: T9SS type A sorting domain-containing protein [Ginsengibacter sp.]